MSLPLADAPNLFETTVFRTFWGIPVPGLTYYILLRCHEPRLGNASKKC